MRFNPRLLILSLVASMKPSAGLLAGTTVLSLLMIFGMARVWRGRAFMPYNTPQSEAGLSGLLVAGVPCAMVVFGATAILWAQMGVDRWHGGALGDACNVLGYAGGSLFLVGGMGMFSVLLFKRPLFLIPPRLRDRYRFDGDNRSV